MSSPTAIDPDRISRAASLRAGPDRQPRTRAQLRRVVTVFVPFSVLMLMMLGGLAFRALLALTQGMH